MREQKEKRVNEIYNELQKDYDAELETIVLEEEQRRQIEEKILREELRQKKEIVKKYLQKEEKRVKEYVNREALRDDRDFLVIEIDETQVKDQIQNENRVENLKSEIVQEKSEPKTDRAEQNLPTDVIEINETQASRETKNEIQVENLNSQPKIDRDVQKMQEKKNQKIQERNAEKLPRSAQILITEFGGPNEPLTEAFISDRRYKLTAEITYEAMAKESLRKSEFLQRLPDMIRSSAQDEYYRKRVLNVRQVLNNWTHEAFHVTVKYKNQPYTLESFYTNKSSVGMLTQLRYVSEKKNLSADDVSNVNFDLYRPMETDTVELNFFGKVLKFRSDSYVQVWTNHGNSVTTHNLKALKGLEIVLIGLNDAREIIFSVL